ncbi:metalloregulator ArsR/SmtB family transcription factor [Martelella sp. HB161492]|uniref:helix-turn-helix transcriptional regulator n=1 Tax=Martelella sp. HB161492 TaxID=2720726 RepID=UPI001FEF3773|nr:metalloregulator ArsR/SmtB family transcription factor [Martelella sp. HB161492]
MHNAGERVLMQLKMLGPMTAADIGRHLHTTGEAARQQLKRLSEQGLVEAISLRSGVGRPQQQWHLTLAGQQRFPDTHAALTVELLETIRAKLGEAAVDTVIAERESKIGTVYSAALARCADLETKVQTLAALRSAEGYMADWEPLVDGTIMLTENHCPICAAAAACQSFCRSEIEIFRKVLGPSVEVQRGEHIVSGGRRCTYLLRETA